MIEIRVKNYSSNNSKRQPWYTINWLENELKKCGIDVRIVDSFTDDSKLKIAAFGIKNLFFKEGDIYLLTFPLYALRDIGLKELRLIFQYPQNFILIFIAIFIPKWKIRNEKCIVLSENGLRYVNPDSFYIFPLKIDLNNLSKSDKSYDYGYFGPPYLTRGFKDVVRHVQENRHLKFLFLLRPDRLFTPLENSLINKLKEEPSANVIVEFLDYDKLVLKISECNNFLLPFPLVMSEGPTVLYEALLYGHVVTTSNSGISKDLIEMGVVSILGLQSHINDRKNNRLSDVISFMNRKNNELIKFLCNEVV